MLDLMLTMLLLTGLNEVGVTEIKGNKHNPRVLYYNSFTTQNVTNDETPWCSSFMSYVVEINGIKSPQSNVTKSWLKWGKKCTSLRPGVLVLMKRHHPWQAHIGIIVKVSKKYIWLLGGNQSNKVSVARFKLKNLLDCRVPTTLSLLD